MGFLVNLGVFLIFLSFVSVVLLISFSPLGKNDGLGEKPPAAYSIYKDFLFDWTTRQSVSSHFSYTEFAVGSSHSSP